ncbi:MAG: hypothetical protein JWR61_1129 [Ferruginibacter sp.]|uniref:DUF416 family protein n=1 Tax=Ferruginibacter sp. TaxID=1940288 RepID=UPI00265A4F22|nr:DUF416 family protein [Ferruginibacter sp.]MDB5276174.1 hypothetical protein [Ferruginibacter sp.]
MNYRDFLYCYNQQVLSLHFEDQLDFAVTVCKKLFFDYEIFSKRYQFGNPDQLLDAILVCEKAKLNQVDKLILEQFIEAINSITPDMDDFGDEISSYALNACVAVYETLQFLVDHNPKHVHDVGICLSDTVDFKIQESGDLTEQQIDEHPMMIEARSFLVDQTKKDYNTMLTEKTYKIKHGFRKIFNFRKWGTY